MITRGVGHIPDWDSRGLLPPFVSSPTSGEGRSPYLVRLTDLVLRFGYTTARRTFLAGLLDYRADLHAAGIKNGFQWINGSFVEDKIGHSGEEPGDIDLVTFFHVPTGQTQGTLAVAHPDLFHPSVTKGRYGVDAYPVTLDASDLRFLVNKSAYWNSLWSHDRNNQWKGYLEIDLSDGEDKTAKAALDEAAKQEAK